MSELLAIRKIFPSSYEETLQLQLNLVAQRARDEIPDTLILTTHHAVFTAGRKTAPESLPKTQTIPLVSVTRGGDVTYHGPGQIVGYWIRKLDGKDRDLHKHLRLLEELLILTCATWQIKAQRVKDLTGVWIGDKKIASIGVAVKNWVTYHGFALNIDVDPQIYDQFRPCGLAGNIMSDLQTEVSESLSAMDVVERLATTFADLYK